MNTFTHQSVTRSCLFVVVLHDRVSLLFLLDERWERTSALNCLIIWSAAVHNQKWSSKKVLTNLHMSDRVQNTVTISTAVIPCGWLQTYHWLNKLRLFLKIQNFCKCLNISLICHECLNIPKSIQIFVERPISYQTERKSNICHRVVVPGIHQWWYKLLNASMCFH